MKTNLLLRASIDVRHLSFLLHLMSFQGTAASSRRLPSKDLGFHQKPRAPQRSAPLTSHMSLMNSRQSTWYNFLQPSFPDCLFFFFSERLEHRGWERGRALPAVRCSQLEPRRNVGRAERPVTAPSAVPSSRARAAPSAHHPEAAFGHPSLTW